jgi:hypothetical protein
MFLINAFGNRENVYVPQDEHALLIIQDSFLQLLLCQP